MRIHRIKKADNFTVINNAIFKSGLSLKARGLYCQIMSLPDDWELSINGLAEILPDGRRAITAAMHELRGLGYVRYIKQHNGRHLEQYWEVIHSQL